MLIPKKNPVLELKEHINNFSMKPYDYNKLLLLIRDIENNYITKKQAKDTLQNEVVKALDMQLNESEGKYYKYGCEKLAQKYFETQVKPNYE